MLLRRSHSSFKIKQFREDTTGCKQREPRLPHEQHHVWEDLKTCWTTNLTSSLCAGTEMGAGVPPALALHLQQPLSRLEMFPEDGARWAQSWQSPRTGSAGLKLYEAKNPRTVEKHQSQQGNLWSIAAGIAPGYRAQQTNCCCCLSSVSSRLWIQRVQWVCQGQTQSWLSGPFQVFTQLKGHNPPLLAQL